MRAWKDGGEALLPLSAISSSHQKVHHCWGWGLNFLSLSREFQSGGVRGRESPTGDMRISHVALGLPSHYLEGKLGRAFSSRL